MVWRNGLLVELEFLEVAGVSDMCLVKSERSMSSISPLLLTLKISSITSVMVEGS